VIGLRFIPKRSAHLLAVKVNPRGDALCVADTARFETLVVPLSPKPDLPAQGA
jgi:hypothetical protein